MSIASRGRGVRVGPRPGDTSAAKNFRVAFARSIAWRVVMLLFSAALFVTSPSAFSQTASRTAFLVAKLKSDDVRVRTQAALALGGTNDDEALSPLCGALDDSADLVRQAVAAALKRLNRGSSSPCLKARLAIERSEPVRLQIARALESLDASQVEPGTDDAPKFVQNAKYYVAISNVTNNTERPQAEIEKLVGAALRSKLDSLGGFQLAPAKEASEAARAVMSKRKLKGFFLSVSVDKFDYSDGNLRVRVKVAVFTYPGKALRGEVPAGVGQTGVRPGDRNSEDTLLGMAAERAIEVFSQNFQ
jgi:hypothetical protein